MAPTIWERAKVGGKKGFDKAWNTVDKLGAPVNRLSNRVGAEAFWPMTLDKESDKAARILRSFCKDGFYANTTEDADRISTDSNGKIDRPKGKQRVLKKIPAAVIQRAVGLAIFTTMRTGLWVSGSGGSGVLLARIPETGEWSPPSGIMLHTAGIGFLAGVDIYDCVVVINTHQALEAFKKVRCTLGGEVSAAAGPFGLGGVLESEVHKRQAPIWTYMKSRGLYAGVQVDGTVIIERTDENERFYGERISVNDILAGKARHPPSAIRTLIQTIKSAQGDTDVDEDVIPSPGATPGDVELQPASTFGVPDPEDPDPFGVKALEAEGLFIREAGTRTRPTQAVFEFKPSPSSPIYSTFRRSMDSSPRSSWRASVQSHISVDRGTQTDGAPFTAATSVSRASSRSNRSVAGRTEANPWDGWETVIPERPTDLTRDRDYDSDQDSLDDDFEVHEISSVTVSKRESTTPSSPVSIEDTTVPPEVKRHSPTFTRARLVTIPKRLPPTLPPRNPSRQPVSQSTPTSPTSPTSSSPDGRRSVVSNPGQSTNAFSELPFRPLDDSTTSLPLNEISLSPTQAPTEKDEFHSVSSAQVSDNELDDKEVPSLEQLKMKTSAESEGTSTEKAESEETTLEGGKSPVESEKSPVESEKAEVKSIEAKSETAGDESTSTLEVNGLDLEKTKSLSESDSHKTAAELAHAT
ncbi:lipid-binding SYLF domain-containing protein [Aspergillus clavatus NRRL 1]|uniref:DUF500 domain protein n=1 Tax=Aspergillus clavatus (strain ATCC 1007 / CBS 513.65 / DSM 816 / NCTC 3887 / NRRL 1 / QM 1276 / 107) TaxID=344612 RepID=A1CA62_ASPCL|nr:DUF500 domain protein [Aspergillus clavatus NRRL 1]EAW12630.1 DUF500 domain protein [Aspergillus clavatus NRRL 1]